MAANKMRNIALEIAGEASVAKHRAAFEAAVEVYARTVEGVFFRWLGPDATKLYDGLRQINTHLHQTTPLSGYMLMHGRMNTPVDVIYGITELAWCCSVFGARLSKLPRVPYILMPRTGDSFHGYGSRPAIDLGADIGGEHGPHLMDEVLGSRRGMVEAAKAIEADAEEMRNFVLQFKSVAQMRKQWPEGQSLYGRYEPEPAANAVAIVAADINRKFGLPRPPQTDDEGDVQSAA